jgi:hypothetical protein
MCDPTHSSTWSAAGKPAADRPLAVRLGKLLKAGGRYSEPFRRK